MHRYIPRLLPYKTSRRLTTLSNVTQSTVEHLRRHGYAIQDGVLSQPEVSGLRSEIEDLIEVGAANANKTYVVSAKGTKTYEKSSVLQAEVHTLSEGQVANVPGLHGLQNDSSLCALISVFWPRMTLREQFVKVQRACGGIGCFPIHVDSSASHDSRKVTALVYPNEEWGDDDGGGLRIYDTPISYLDITPKPGRLVLLSSCGMHHRVLQSSKQRYAITVWLSGKLRKEGVEAPELGSVEGRVGYEMVCSDLRDAAFRIVLRDEWVNSLRESHDGKEQEEVLQEFDRNLQAIRRIVPRVLSGRKELAGISVTEIERIVENKDLLKKGFEDIDDACDGVPFVW